MTSEPAYNNGRGGFSNRLRERLAGLMGVDRWVEGAFPAVQPDTTEQVSRLLKGYPNPVVVAGSGSSFPRDFNPAGDTLVLLTRKLRGSFELVKGNQVLLVSAGWPLSEVNHQLKSAGYIVPALARFDVGTIGGRLAWVSAKPVVAEDCGWMHYLLGLEVVLSSGEILKLGGRCIKDVAGYDLRFMFTGSRGAMGVITRAAFRCRPIGTVPPPAPFENSRKPGRIDPQWRRLFDPMGRFIPGA